MYRGKRDRQHTKGKKSDIADVKILKHNDRSYLYCIRNANLEEYQACCECLSTKQKYTPVLVYKRDYDYSQIFIDHENRRVLHKVPNDNLNQSKVSERSDLSTTEEFKLLKRRAMVYDNVRPLCNSVHILDISE
jgi:hypothetical protein